MFGGDTAHAFAGAGRHGRLSLRRGAGRAGQVAEPEYGFQRGDGKS